MRSNQLNNSGRSATRFGEFGEPDGAEPHVAATAGCIKTIRYLHQLQENIRAHSGLKYLSLYNPSDRSKAVGSVNFEDIQKKHDRKLRKD